MKSNLLLRLMMCAAVVICLGSDARSANKAKPSLASTDALQRLLESEADSSNDAVDRRSKLKPESRPSSDPELMWWQAGFVQSGKEWQAYEKSLPSKEHATRLDEYRGLRSDVASQPHGQWKLANWCRKNGLFDQERVHLTRVLADRDSAANPDAVYERLGYQKTGDFWVSPRERLDAAARIREIELSRKHWGTKLESIVQRLDGSPKQRSQAEKQLKEIHHRSAVPEIVSALCVSNQMLAEYGVQTLGQIREFEASRALAGQAVFSPWNSVRTKAIEELKPRKLEEFAPDLLLTLTNPIRTRRDIDVKAQTATTAMATSPDFQMNWDYVWIDENYDTIRVGIRRLFPVSTSANQVNLFSIARPGISGQYDANSGIRTNGGTAIAILEIVEQAELLDRAADTMNEFRATTNERVGKVLSECTGEPTSADPRNWWTWWTTYSSVASFERKNVVIVDERKMQPGIPSLTVRNIQRSCLVAGTPVWTEQGLVPIEKVQPGDRVLSKEIETGELTYKPVMQTTEREPAPVLKFSVGDEAIEASLGHHFWVSGEGWTKTRQLNSQQPLHTVTGMQRILNLEDQGRVEKVYNLVVADFHTYFVGKSMVLSHDVLPPEQTNVKIPGMLIQ